jgi:hypothetical protein
MLCQNGRTFGMPPRWGAPSYSLVVSLVPLLAGTAATPNYEFLADTITRLPTLLLDDRQSKGLTVEQQATRIGISPNSLSGLGPLSRTSTTAACLRYLAP